MNKRNFSYLFIYLILATITLTASVFAWVTLSKQTDVGGINSNIPNFTEMITFEVKRKGETQYTLIETIEEMHLFFGKTAPSETYEFKIDIDNKLNRNLDVRLYLPKFESSLNDGVIIDPNIDYNLYNILDVFYIKEGMVNVDRYDRLTSNYISSDPAYILTPNNQSTPIKHGQTLNLFRISNLIIDNAIDLTEVSVLRGEKASITFTLVYDELTIDNTYQDFVLSFDGIYIFSEQVT